MEKYYSIRDLSNMLNVSVPTLWVWIREGKFPRADFKPTKRVTRWSHQTVKEWLEKQANDSE